jgi:membrane protease YdiL (CAAX protease family)
MSDQMNPDEEIAREAAPPPFTIFHCIGLVVLWALLQFFVVLIMNRMGLDPLKNPNWKQIALITGISGVLTAEAGAILAGLSLTRMLTTPFQPSILLPLLLSLVGLSILSSELANLLQKIQPLPEEVNLYKKLLQENVVGILLAVSLIIPITEELIFRGIMLEGLSEHYRFRIAYLVSALFFALSHVHPWLMINAFGIGLFLNWIRIRSGSILTCIVFHGFYNGLPFLLDRTITVAIPGFNSPQTANVEFQPLWFDLLGVVLFVAGVWGIRMMPKQTEQVFVRSL